ncbi:MAG: hypothetical protein HYU41_18255 [Candidatus Rokubacteria bacterium]|nr:hypothetical protein [Candidatus Rokubacteria bacterium]
MRRTSSVWIALALVALVACQSVRLVDPAGRPGASPPDVARHADARARSERLRAALDDVSAVLAREGAATAVSEPTHSRVREIKREYFAAREVLFELALLHAPAIVDRRDTRDPRPTLDRIALSLMAATELVTNFHAVATVLGRAPALRRTWNAPDPALGIPENSWSLALESYRNARYRELFAEAIDRLAAHRRALERDRIAGDPVVTALFPGGVSAGLDAARRTHALLSARLAEEDLAEDQAELQALRSRARAVRTAWAALAPSLAQAVARDGGLVRGEVHLALREVKREYVELRDRLWGLTFKHAGKLDRPDVPYPPVFRLRAVGISLLAAMTLYENARELELRLLPLRGMRALLNQADPALGIRRGFWDGVERELLRAGFRTVLEAGIQVFEDEGRTPVDADSDLRWLVGEILTSAGADEARRERVALAIAHALRHWARRLDLVDVALLRRGVLKEGTTQVSKVISNLAGAVEWRKGKLYDQAAWLAFVRERLEPGDLLLERTPFRLTDRFIPGYFGHVAMYVGTADDVRRLDLADHPWVAPWLGQVASGRTVVEALRQGTQINTLEHFLNVDDLVIMRPKPGAIPRADVVRAVALAFSHVGKRYDFAFDNNTWDAIVCSELAFQTYVGVRWPFARVLNAFTISPDDVAVLAGADAARPFELVTFIRDGRVVHDRRHGVLDEASFAAVLGPRYRAAER